VPQYWPLPTRVASPIPHSARRTRDVGIGKFPRPQADSYQCRLFGSHFSQGVRIWCSPTDFAMRAWHLSMFLTVKRKISRGELLLRPRADSFLPVTSSSIPLQIVCPHRLLCCRRQKHS